MQGSKTLILSCLFDNKAGFTEFKLPMAIIFACLSEFTSELEKECLTLPVLLIEQVHSNLDCAKYPYPPHGRDRIFQGGRGVNLLNFPVGRGGNHREIFPEGSRDV